MSEAQLWELRSRYLRLVFKPNITWAEWRELREIASRIAVVGNYPRLA